jgi:hypothetical protein
MPLSRTRSRRERYLTVILWSITSRLLSKRLWADECDRGRLLSRCSIDAIEVCDPGALIPLLVVRTRQTASPAASSRRVGRQSVVGCVGKVMRDLWMATAGTLAQYSSPGCSNRTPVVGLDVGWYDGCDFGQQRSSALATSATKRCPSPGSLGLLASRRGTDRQAGSDPPLPLASPMRCWSF